MRLQFLSFSDMNRSNKIHLKKLKSLLSFGDRNDSPESRLISESDDSDTCNDNSGVAGTATSDLVLDGTWTGIGSGMSSSTWGVTCFDSRQGKRCFTALRNLRKNERTAFLFLPFLGFSKIKNNKVLRNISVNDY